MPKLKIKEYIEKGKIKYDNQFDYSQSEATYNTVTRKCVIRCTKHNHIFSVDIRSHLSNVSGGCSICAKEHRKEHINNVDEIANKYISKLQAKYGDKYDYSLIKKYYVDSYTKVPIICHQKDEHGKEHGIHWIRPNSSLSHNNCCPKCVRQYHRTTEELLEILREKYGNDYEYSEEGFADYVNAWSLIKIKCKRCGREFKQYLHSHLNKQNGCPYCRRSHLESMLERVLNKTGIKFIPQKRFDWLGTQSFDFYLPDYNISIECQGRQHFVPIEQFDGEEGFNKTKERDQRKARLSKEHDISILYILDKESKQFYKSQPNYFIKVDDLINHIRSLPAPKR